MAFEIKSAAPKSIKEDIPLEQSEEVGGRGGRRFHVCVCAVAGIYTVLLFTWAPVPRRYRQVVARKVGGSKTERRGEHKEREDKA